MDRPRTKVEMFCVIAANIAEKCFREKGGKRERQRQEQEAGAGAGQEAGQEERTSSICGEFKFKGQPMIKVNNACGLMQSIRRIQVRSATNAEPRTVVSGR